MSDRREGPGWWIADDGRWYPPSSDATKVCHWCAMPIPRGAFVCCYCSRNYLRADAIEYLGHHYVVARSANELRIYSVAEGRPVSGERFPLNDPRAIKRLEKLEANANKSGSGGGWVGVSVPI